MYQTNDDACCSVPHFTKMCMQVQKEELLRLGVPLLLISASCSQNLGLTGLLGSPTSLNCGKNVYVNLASQTSTGKQAGLSASSRCLLARPYHVTTQPCRLPTVEITAVDSSMSVSGSKIIIKRPDTMPFYEGARKVLSESQRMSMSQRPHL